MGFAIANVRKAYDHLTDGGFTEATSGRVAPMTPQGACGLIGGWTVETGDPELRNLDVVEKGNNQKGRGMSQYTGVRRTAYDKARTSALAAGEDVNSLDWQLEYAADEYTGKHDVDGKSLSGWTKSLEHYGQSDDVREAAIGMTSGTSGREGYFRPSKPHMDRRIAAAERCMTWMSKPQPIQETAVAPTPTAPTPIRPFGSDAVLNGNPVKWGGANYGWQSPSSFATIKPPAPSAPPVSARGAGRAAF